MCFMNEHFFVYNGFLFRSRRPVIMPDHPSFAFGDGLFETMRMHHGVIINRHLHFERLRKGMKALQYDTPTTLFENISDNIKVLVAKNHEKEMARVRLSVCRSSGSFGDNNSVDYLIESDTVVKPLFVADGQRAVIYEASTKGLGILSNLKTKNYLLSILAHRYARSNGADDSILLNAYGRVCETSIANIYFVEDGKVLTPALAEGCVAGTVRCWLLHHLSNTPYHVTETECTIDRLLNAREVFISNAIKWVQPVRAIGDTTFDVDFSEKIFRLMENTIV